MAVLPGFDVTTTGNEPQVGGRENNRLIIDP
jgi:hypothetical protein